MQSIRARLTPPLWLLTLLGLVGVVYLILALREIVFLLVIGYCVAYVLDPILDRLELYRVPRSIGFFIILGCLFLLVALMLLTVIPVLLREYTALTQNLPDYVETLKSHVLPLMGEYRDKIPGFSSDGFSVEEIFPLLKSDGVQKVGSGVVQTLLKGYSVTLTLVNLVLLPFIMYYLAIDFDGLHRRALQWLPLHWRPRVADVFSEMNGYVSAFIRGQLLVGAILSLLYCAGLGMIGVELWVLLGLVAGLGNIVPYLGFALGIVLSSIMALVTFGDFWHVAYVWLVFAVVQGLEGTVITPKIIGDSVGISALAVILAIFAGGQLFGLLGVFLAVPVAASAKVLLRRVREALIDEASENAIIPSKSDGRLTARYR